MTTHTPSPIEDECLKVIASYPVLKGFLKDFHIDMDNLKAGEPNWHVGIEMAKVFALGMQQVIKDAKRKAN